jgi:N-formylglutamate amidohydrolase
VNPGNTLHTDDAGVPPSAVLHVPHSAVVIPAQLRRRLLLSHQERQDELLIMTDWFTDELYSLLPWEAVQVRFPVSRLIVDPERFQDDAEEPMAARGMGVIYTRTADGRPLRDPPSDAERAALIGGYYTPHHEQLSAAVDAVIEDYGRCLLIDCHSFPSRPLPCDLDQTPNRPDICLGTDASHTPEWLVNLAHKQFSAVGLEVGINQPYAGVLVPVEHAGFGSAVDALMIEVNRKLYMDEQTGRRLDTFDGVRVTVQRVMRHLIAGAAARRG